MRCRRRSAVSSGWNAVASTRPCRTAIGVRPGRAPAPRPRSDLRHHRGTDEDAVQRLVAERRHLDIRLERIELATEGVALHRHVKQAQHRFIAVGQAIGKQDHAGAGAQHRCAAARHGHDRLSQAVEVDKASPRGIAPPPPGPSGRRVPAAPPRAARLHLRDARGRRPLVDRTSSPAEPPGRRHSGSRSRTRGRAMHRGSIRARVVAGRPRRPDLGHRMCRSPAPPRSIRREWRPRGARVWPRTRRGPGLAAGPPIRVCAADPGGCRGRW